MVDPSTINIGDELLWPPDDTNNHLLYVDVIAKPIYHAEDKCWYVGIDVYNKKIWVAVERFSSRTSKEEVEKRSKRLSKIAKGVL
jgi:hypothetical protein